uniref:Transposase n=1 Tax=Macrostomum lignano TaxID=282301 RepID=A0A1I8HQK8_9PLAT
MSNPPTLTGRASSLSASCLTRTGRSPWRWCGSTAAPGRGDRRILRVRLSGTGRNYATMPQVDG